MSLGEYLEGLAFFTVVWGAAAASGVLVWQRLLWHLRGAAAGAAVGVLGFSALIAAHLVPGAIGILSRWSVAATSVALLALLWWRLPIRTPPEEVSPAEPAESRASWAIALTGAGVAAAALLALLAAMAHAEPPNPDYSLWQLPNIIRWIQTDSLFTFSNFVPNLPTGAYPNTGDVIYLSAILPWRNAALVHVTAVPLLALSATATYALARELRASRPTAVLVTAVLLTIPNIWLPPLETVKPDAFFIAAFACALLFAARHARTAASSDLVLAGVALGLAFGSRLYGISCAVVVITVWVGVQLLGRRPLPQVLRGGGVLAGLTLIVGGVWLLRTAIATGNPLYPVNIEVLGATIFDAPRILLLDRFGYSISDYLTDWDVLADPIYPALRLTLGLPGLLLAIGALGAAALAVRRLRRPQDRSREVLVALGLLGCAGGIAIAYAITPGSAQGPPGDPLLGTVGTNTRWLMPAFVAAAGVTAWAVSALGRGRWRIVAHAILLIGVLRGAETILDRVSARFALAAVAGVLALGGAIALARRPNLRAAIGRPAVAVAIVLVVCVALAAIGRREQNQYNRISYADETFEWVRANAPPGTRIGLAGNAINVPIARLFGSRFDNQVSWVGPERDSQLQNYETREEFGAALRREDFQLLMVFLAEKPPWEVAEDPASRDAGYVRSLPPQRWARAAGFRTVARSKIAALLARAPGAPPPS